MAALVGAMHKYHLSEHRIMYQTLCVRQSKAAGDVTAWSAQWDD